MNARALIAVILALAIVGGSGATAEGDARRATGVVLNEGMAERRGSPNRFHWRISAFDPPPCIACIQLPSFRRPCLALLSGEFEDGPEDGVGTVTTEAHCAPEPLSATSAPVIVATTLPVGTSQPFVTAVGMAFGSAARSLQATFPDGKRETIHLRQLTVGQAKAIHRMRFRYAAFAVRGRWCPVHLASLGVDDRVLWEGTEPSCPRSSEQPQLEDGPVGRGR